MVSLEYTVILGIGFIFVVGIMLSVITKKYDLEYFLVYATIGCAFSVWANLLPLWVLILLVFSVITMVYINFQKEGK